MLAMTQDDLAAAATVARATINRFESGKGVGEGQIKLMRYAMEEAGVYFIPDGAVVGGVALLGGVAMRSPAVRHPVDSDPAPDV